MKKGDNEAKILNALLCCGTIKAAAEQCQVTTKTIYNYLDRPEFKRKYDKAKADIISQTTRVLQKSSAKAVSMIIEIAEDITNNEQTRLNACRTILEYSLKYTDQYDILSRIEALEAATNAE